MNVFIVSGCWFWCLKHTSKQNQSNSAKDTNAPGEPILHTRNDPAYYTSVPQKRILAEIVKDRLDYKAIGRNVSHKKEEFELTENMSSYRTGFLG